MKGFPEPGITPLRGGPALRWGVLAPGEIAGDFTDALHRSTDQRVVAVGSRAADRAEAFARRHGLPRAHGGYAALVADEEVDVVYVAAPHAQHLPLALLAIEAGKHVLVENPLAMTAVEGRRIAAAARAAGVFAGEAMWTAYLPQTAVLRRLLARGDLGELRLATVDVGWAAGPRPAPRFVDPALGGGTVLDAGVYGFWLAQAAVGRPVEVRAMGDLRVEGVDEQAVVLLRGSRGALATVTSTMAGTSSGLATIVGSEGRVHFLDPFVFPSRFRLHTASDSHEWRDTSGLTGRQGLAWQAAAGARHRRWRPRRAGASDRRCHRGSRDHRRGPRSGDR